MTTITGLVHTLITDDPKNYGSDRRTGRLFSKVLEIMEQEQADAPPFLTTVERVRRKFLEQNPRYDFRVADKKK